MVKAAMKGSKSKIPGGKAKRQEKKVKRGVGPSAWWKDCLAMASVGILQSLWEKPIWESVWSYLDPMDSVCLRTASVEWNVSGKYGPHGELFFPRLILLC